METVFDAIVVGSGASGAHAAYRLVEGGRSVAMIDVGHEDSHYAPLIPNISFVDLRHQDAQQHRYLLGDRLEGIPKGGLAAGAQLTPPRQYVLKDSESLAPTTAANFSALQSFALGGLASAWGAVSFPFLDGELSRCGLPVDDLRAHYDIVSRRIGISGWAEDDLAPMRGPLEALQPALSADHNAALILRRYEDHRASFKSKGIAVGHPLLSVLSEPLGGRQPNPYHDMDFWANHERSVYRPELTVRQLQLRPNFQYIRPLLVERFVEGDGGQVRIRARDLSSGAELTLRARVLVLSAGALGTTRIVLRSLGVYERRVPLVCNPHSYLVGVNHRNLGRSHSDRCHSLAQLTLIFDPTGRRDRLVQAQMYSYRSLMLFRLLNELPLPYREGIRILRALAPSLVIWAIQHEDCPAPSKFCLLHRGAHPLEDQLEIHYAEAPTELADRESRELTISRSIARLGCWPQRRTVTGHGSSIHYGGQLPFSADDRPLTTEPSSGRLRGTRSVYVADGAAFSYLPAKGPTLTLMAYADRVGKTVLQNLKAML